MGATPKPGDSGSFTPAKKSVTREFGDVWIAIDAGDAKHSASSERNTEEHATIFKLLSKAEVVLVRLDERSDQRTKFAGILQWILRLVVTAFLAISSWFLNDFSDEMKSIRIELDGLQGIVETDLGLRRDVNRIEKRIHWIENGRRGHKPAEKEE